MTHPSPERARFHAFVTEHQRFVLTTHINPDGDGLGSEVAMALWLEGLGKTAWIVNDSPLPAAFRFLNDVHPIEDFDPQRAARHLDAADAIIVLDTSNRARIGRVAPLLEQQLAPIAVVDHHVSHAGFGQINVIEPEASATGEILYDLLREALVPINREMAEALYIALITDTGSFRYSNTDAHAHRMAAELLGFGIDPPRLHAQVSSHATPGRLRFFGEVLSALEVRDEGRIIVLEATPEHFRRHGLIGPDTEGLVDMPRSIAGVDVVALFSELEPGKVKVSLRSTGRVAIDSVVTRLGGGGHAHAAGAMLSMTRAEAKARVLPELARIVNGTPVSAVPQTP